MTLAVYSRKHRRILVEIPIERDVIKDRMIDDDVLNYLYTGALARWRDEGLRWGHHPEAGWIQIITDTFPKWDQVWVELSSTSLIETAQLLAPGAEHDVDANLGDYWSLRPRPRPPTNTVYQCNTVRRALELDDLIDDLDHCQGRWMHKHWEPIAYEDADPIGQDLAVLHAQQVEAVCYTREAIYWWCPKDRTLKIKPRITAPSLLLDLEQAGLLQGAAPNDDKVVGFVRHLLGLNRCDDALAVVEARITHPDLKASMAQMCHAQRQRRRS